MKADKLSIAYVAAVIVLLVLTGFSLYAYKERMLFADPSWITFNIINTKSFCFSEHRYGAFITQLFPLAGVYLGLSLKTILQLYSVSFYLFYLGSVFLIGFAWKQKWMGILLTVYLTLFVSDGYFWPNNEVHQGITWMFLFLAYYSYSSKKNWLSHVLLFAFAFFAISSHMLVLLPFLFLWIWIHPAIFKTPFNVLQQKHFLIYSLLLISLMGVRYILSNQGWYDSEKLIAIKQVSFSTIIHVFESGQSVSFLNLLFTNYWIALIPLAGSIVLLLLQKKYYQLGFFLLSIFTYYLLICIVYPDSFNRNLRFYMESEWAGLSVIISTPFVLYLPEMIRKAGLIAAVFAALFFTRLGYIHHSFTYFHNRLEQLGQLTNTLAQQKINKAVIVEDKSITNQLFIMDWGLPVESLLLSELNGMKPAVTFKLVDQQFETRQLKDSFYSCFEVQPVSLLNKKYFSIDTTHSYHVILGIISN